MVVLWFLLDKLTRFLGRKLKVFRIQRSPDCFERCLARHSKYANYCRFKMTVMACAWHSFVGSGVQRIAACILCRANSWSVENLLAIRQSGRCLLSYQSEPDLTIHLLRLLNVDYACSHECGLVFIALVPIHISDSAASYQVVTAGQVLHTAVLSDAQGLRPFGTSSKYYLGRRTLLVQQFLLTNRPDDWFTTEDRRTQVPRLSEP